MSVHERVVEIIIERGYERDKVTPEADFEADLGFDSLDKVQFAMEVEETFDITVPDDLYDDLRTVGDAARLVEERVTGT